MSLLLTLFERLTVVVTIAYLFSRTPLFRRLLRQDLTWREKGGMVIIFGIITILGTYYGIPVKGAIANSRAVGAIVAGLLGGPAVGAITGLIGGIHRWSLGGFTGFACAVSTTIEGLLGGLVNKYWPKQAMDWRVGFVTGFIAESLQMLIILALARPFVSALDLVKVIAAPMTIVNAAGIAIFIMIVRQSFQEQERIAAFMAQLALKIANYTLPILRHGLTIQSAGEVAQIILRETGSAAVAITDRENILAHVGAGSDHHLPGQPIQTEATRIVIETGQTKIAGSRQEIDCSHPTCPLNTAVIVPLRQNQQVVGTLKIYHRTNKPVTEVEIEFANGLAHLFSTQLELAELERRSQLLADAEIRALQAQINPHFLFNALNTIMLFCRTDPEKARGLLAQLGDYFRKNLQDNKRLVDIREEIEHVKAYLAIEEARFGHRITITWQIDPELRPVKIPPLTLQPLVENALRHGLLPKRGFGNLQIGIKQERNQALVWIEDDGVGFNQTKKESDGSGMGLKNVDARLRSWFGPEAGLKIISPLPGQTYGTRVEFVIPEGVQK
ncbi:two-component system, LytT family, sensor histidine kinase LytS [Carboxydocella sporoproducens DSM 16521]|uniref:histidine kinase n=2 Tax=Carboxydocella TaxID=178898 RepID=A0A1T4PX52_9FIRM|nr:MULTISPECIES: sensor histidine kinase [Carboxydocella]AVX20477.1 two-component system, LytT family, sensor histidine kinase LytS [Carboxydocella thermautotrophica]SJZ96069.1 two-component system, LytT family, sensor histidine kinase LytS [Carboxydocella sporoproducens DSM 16521]